MFFSGRPFLSLSNFFLTNNPLLYDVSFDALRHKLIRFTHIKPNEKFFTKKNETKNKTNIKLVKKIENNFIDFTAAGRVFFFDKIARKNLPISSGKIGKQLKIKSDQFASKTELK